MKGDIRWMPLADRAALKVAAAPRRLRSFIIAIPSVTSALVRFRFFAFEDFIDLGDSPAGPVFQLGADLIVSGSPGECFEHLGRRRLGLHDPHQHRIVERPDYLDDLCGGCRSRNLAHRTVPPVLLGSGARCLGWREVMLAQRDTVLVCGPFALSDCCATKRTSSP